MRVDPQRRHLLQGCIDLLLGDCATACDLRSRFVFKVVPMLNPDGVVNGSYRCGLAGCDLNRQWDKPSPTLHPTIYHTRALLRQLSDAARLHTYIDMHGHSMREGAFMFGCDPLPGAPLKAPVATMGDSQTSASARHAEPPHCAVSRSGSGAASERSHSGHVPPGNSNVDARLPGSLVGLSEHELAQLQVRILPHLLGRREPLFDYKVCRA